jgi:hypothetical protein
VAPSARIDRCDLAAAALALLAFAAYAALRQTHVGGSDSWGYYSLTLLFEQGRLSLPVGFDPERFPAVVPLGYTEIDGRVAPSYSPGLPLLMWAMRPFGLEWFVVPAFGAASVWLLFRLARRHVRPTTALAFAALLAASPAHAMASQQVMTDAVAVAFALGVLLLHAGGRFAAAGVWVGLSLAVRPTNVLFFVLVAGSLVLRPRDLLRFGAGFAVGVLPVAIYDQVQFGSPLSTGYGGRGDDFRTDVFPHHAAFYLRATLVQLSPLALLALVPAFRRAREHAFLLAWFPLFFLFYSFFWPGADAWWYTRYLLPSYPALLVLAAIGSERARAWVAARGRAARAASAPASALILAACLAGLLAYGHARNVWAPSDDGSAQARSAFVVRDALPPDAVVGSIELSGTLRLYAGLETFHTGRPGVPALVEFVLGQGRPAYVLVEPWNQQHPGVAALRERFAFEPVLELGVWPGTRLYRLSARPSPDAGAPAGASSAAPGTRRS